MSAPVSNDDYALIVGVKEYVIGSQYRALRGPPTDCEDFRRWLLQDAGLPPQNIQSVVWSRQKQMPYPSRSDVNLALSLILKPAGKDDVPGGRRLYLFSAGHCEGTESLHADVITAEARPPTQGSFPITKVAEMVRKAQLFQEIVVFVDGCRNRSDGESLPCPLRLPRGTHDTRVLYAFACGYDRPAYERRFGSRYRGIFTCALMEGLRGKARTKKNRITADSLEKWLLRRVASLRSKGQDQQPEVYCPKTDSQPFVLCP